MPISTESIPYLLQPLGRCLLFILLRLPPEGRARRQRPPRQRPRAVRLPPRRRALVLPLPLLLLLLLQGVQLGCHAGAVSRIQLLHDVIQRCQRSFGSSRCTHTHVRVRRHQSLDAFVGEVLLNNIL